MSKITDYPGAMRRIWEAHGDNDAIFESDVRDLLRESHTMTQRTINEFVNGGIATIENVVGTLEGRGELPDPVDLASAIQSNSAFDDGSRSQQLADDLGSTLVMQDDINAAVEAAQDREGPVFADNVESAMRSKTGGKQWVGADENETTQRVRSQLGAVDRSEVDQARQEAVQFDAGQSPRDVLGDSATDLPGVGDATADQNFGAVRGDDGEISAVVSANESAGRAVADELGVDYQSPQDVNSEFEVTQGPGRAELRYRGDTIREFEV